MSLYLWAATAGSPTGFFLFSFVAQNYSWRHVFWALLGICGGFWILMTFTLLYCGETRHSVLLFRRAEAERARTGNDNIDVPDDAKRRGVKDLIQVALTRPFRFLAVEAIIIFGALYNGYLYGLSFLFNGAFTLIFGPDGHGFSIVGVGLAFLGITIGICIGPLTNLWQEQYFQQIVKDKKSKHHPEARVQHAKLAAIGKTTLLLADIERVLTLPQFSRYRYFGSLGRPHAVCIGLCLLLHPHFGVGPSTSLF